MAAACAGLGGQAVNQSWLMLVLSLGQLSKWFGASWNQMLLVWENLGRSEAWTKTSHSYGKNHWKQLGWALKLSGEGPQGIIGVEQCEPGWWSLIYGTHLPALSLSGESAQKRNNGLCQHFSLGESCSSSFCLDTGQFSSSAYVSGALWAAYCLCAGAESKWVWIIPCAGPLRMPGTPEHTIFLSQES